LLLLVTNINGGYEMVESNETAKKSGKKGFLIHLLIYIIINVFLAIMNILTAPGYLWFLWVTGGWGIAVVIHGIAVFAS
jgi:hypothetical protein